MDTDNPNIIHGPKVPLEIVPKLTLGQFLFNHLKSHSPYDVLMSEAETGRLITPIEFLSLSIRVAEGLKDLGVLPDDIVCIIGKATIDSYATATGILFRGATAFPVDSNLPPDQFGRLLRITSPKIVFCDVDVADEMAEVLSELNIHSPIIIFSRDTESESPYQTFASLLKEEVDFQQFSPVPTEDTAESLAFLVCSSGTTGTPKPVMLTHRNLLFQATIWRIFISSNKILKCPAITFSYFFWVSGIMLYMMTLTFGFEMTIVQRHDAKHILRVIDRQKPVWGMFSPALLKQVLWHPEFKNYNVSSLLLLITAGTSLQRVVVNRMKENWGSSISCNQSYGITEISGSATVAEMGDDTLSVGRLVPGFHMKILSTTDESVLGPGQKGEIYLKSYTIMKGYMGNREATEGVLRDGWLKTGDIGWYDETGLIYITGRVKDLIKVNDLHICPQEIEDEILTIPGVTDAGVVGIPLDENQNHFTVALVVTEIDAELTVEDIWETLHEKLPEEKQLQEIFLVDNIQRTSSGKMKRGELLSEATLLYNRK